MRYFILAIFFLAFSAIIFAQSEAGNALSLDGDGDYAWVADHPSLNPQTHITVEAWVWSDNFDGSVWQEFIMKGGNDSSIPRQYYLRPRQHEGRLQFVVHDTDDHDNTANSDDTLSNGTWYHVAGVYDGQFVSVYINGVLQDQDDKGNFNIQTSTGILAFGRLGELDVEYFDGQIDEVRIWNVARTQSQLISTMTDTLSSVYYATADSGLVGYWRFDVLESLDDNNEGAENIRDYSIYGNHATIEDDALLVPSGALVSVERLDDFYPSDFVLYQNYPNPFNPGTTINFSIPDPSFVLLVIYNSLGEEIETLVAEELSAGNYKYDWIANGLTSGIYFYKLQTENFVETKKMILLK